jgi:hypothetical protein
MYSTMIRENAKWLVTVYNDFEGDGDNPAEIWATYFPNTNLHCYDNNKLLGGL